MRTAQDETFDHLRHLLDSALECRYRERAGGYFGRLLRRVRVVVPEELVELLEAGIEAGVLSEEPTFEVGLADLILRGRHPANGAEVYLVVEVAVEFGSDDVERASRRAGLLGRLRPTLAVVAGERITPEAAALAAARGVWRVLDGQVTAPSEPGG